MCGRLFTTFLSPLALGALGEYYPVVDAFTEDGHPVPPEMWPLSHNGLGNAAQVQQVFMNLTLNSGKGKFFIEPLNLSAVIPEMIGLVRPSISTKITLHLDLDEGLPSIAADRGLDDEPMVLGMAKKALERHGYTVLVADSGAAAIDVAKSHPGEIELVVLDLNMPHMSGKNSQSETTPIHKNK